MGLLDGISANLLQSDSDGKSYYAPLGRFGPVFEVPSDEEAYRLRRRYQKLMIGDYLVMVGVITVAVAMGGWPWLLLLPATALMFIAVALFFARRLPRAKITHADLIPISRAAALDAYVAATGRKTLELIATANLVVCGLVLLMTLWIGGIVMWLMTSLLAFFTVIHFRALRRARE